MPNIFFHVCIKSLKYNLQQEYYNKLSLDWNLLFYKPDDLSLFSSYDYYYNTIQIKKMVLSLDECNNINVLRPLSSCVFFNTLHFILYITLK